MNILTVRSVLRLILRVHTTRTHNTTTATNSLFLYSPAAQCPADFFESGGRCYSVIDQVHMTWDECRAACQALDGGVLSTDLATFETAEELETFSITWLDVCKYCYVLL